MKNVQGELPLRIDKKSSMAVKDIQERFRLIGQEEPAEDIYEALQDLIIS